MLMVSFFNVGKLTLNTNPKFVSCTPQACMELIDFYIDVEVNTWFEVKAQLLDYHYLLLMNRDAVSVCHARTENIKEITKMADILISCCGRPHLVRRIGSKRILIIVGITKLKIKYTVI